MGSRRSSVVRTTRAYRPDDGWETVALAASGVGAFARWCWRWRTEWAGLLALAVVGPLVWGIGTRIADLMVGPVVGPALAPVLGPLFAPLPLIGLLAGLLAWPRSRRWLRGRLACARTRRQIIAVLRETRVPDSADRLPLIRRSTPTPVGERLLLTVRPGQSAEMLAGFLDALRAGARARDVTVSRDPARADRVTVEVIRRDLLSAPEPLTSPLLDLARHLTAAPVPAPTIPNPAVEGADQ